MVHGVGYWSVGIGDLDAEAYAESENPMAWALSAWMRQPPHGRPEMRIGLMDKILRFAGDGWYRGLLLDTLWSYFKLNPQEQAEEERLLQSEQFGEVNEMLHTEMGRLRQEERRDTLQQGVLEVIRARFPMAPQELEEQIRRVRNVKTLQQWLRRAAVANSLEEIEQLLAS